MYPNQKRIKNKKRNEVKLVAAWRKGLVFGKQSAGMWTKTLNGGLVFNKSVTGCNLGLMFISAASRLKLYVTEQEGSEASSLHPSHPLSLHHPPSLCLKDEEKSHFTSFVFIFSPDWTESKTWLNEWMKERRRSLFLSLFVSEINVWRAKMNEEEEKRFSLKM